MVALAGGDFVVRQAAYLWVEPGPEDLHGGGWLLYSSVFEHRDRLLRVQLVLDLRVDVPAGHARQDEQEERRGPRPERTATDRLVVLVDAGRRRVAGRGRRRPRARDLGRRTRDARRPGAAEDRRRRLLG